MEEMKAEKEKNDLKGCTFSPQLYKPRRVGDDDIYVQQVTVHNPQQYDM